MTSPKLVDRRPLEGKVILVLRPEGLAGEFAGRLESLGGRPVVVPAIRILPPRSWGALDALLQNPGRYDWAVFTSVNGVAAVASRMKALEAGRAGLPGRIAAVGPATKQALETAGLPVSWMPSTFTTEALGRELPGPARVSLIRAEAAGRRLEEILEERGFDVVRVDAYRSEPANTAAIREAVAAGPDVVALTSASIVDAFLAAAGGAGAALVACIGPATAEACRRAGLTVDVEADEHTAAGLVKAIAGHYRTGDRRADTRRTG